MRGPVRFQPPHECEMGGEGGGEGGEGGEGGGGSDAAANARACRRPSDFVAANRASRQPGGLRRLARVEKFHEGAKVRVGIFFVGIGLGS